MKSVEILTATSHFVFWSGYSVFCFLLFFLEIYRRGQQRAGSVAPPKHVNYYRTRPGFPCNNLTTPIQRGVALPKHVTYYRTRPGFPCNDLTTPIQRGVSLPKHVTYYRTLPGFSCNNLTTPIQRVPLYVTCESTEQCMCLSPWKFAGAHMDPDPPLSLSLSLFLPGFL